MNEAHERERLKSKYRKMLDDGGWKKQLPRKSHVTRTGTTESG